ncbi:MAG: nuclear transport factor 2 family protein [Streptomyces sp.]|nr:nuclear transport factor 2 family protein [Streptomyces sp.]
MDDFRATADRVAIEALRAEFTDAAMMRDYERLVSLFTPDAVWGIPEGGIEAVGRDALLRWFRGVPDKLEFFVQSTHPGVIRLDGDTATGRAYMHELIRQKDGAAHQNFAIYHDRYARTGGGWRFAERLYEIRYLDTTPLAGSPTHPLSVPASSPYAEG